MTYIEYPDAYHDFDIASLRDGRRYFGHWLQYDADAAAKANAQMHDFLRRELQ